MTFRVGQKVVCVDDSPAWTDGSMPLKRGATYTINEVSVPKNFLVATGVRRDIGVRVFGIQLGNYEWFDPRRFAVECKTAAGMAILRKLLKTKQRVSA